MIIPSTDWRRQGFTIVELLIVIVIIAVLAAITIVAYNGIQDRAYETRAISIADSYKKIFQMYYVDHSAYPNYEKVCLGSTANYPATSNFSAGQCEKSTDENISVNQNFNDAVSVYATSIPDGSLPTVDINGNGDGIRGVSYTINPGSNAQAALISYIIKGNAKCPQGFQVANVPPNLTQCVLLLGDWQ